MGEEGRAGCVDGRGGNGFLWQVGHSRMTVGMIVRMRMRVVVIVVIVVVVHDRRMGICMCVCLEIMRNYTLAG